MTNYISQNPFKLNNKAEILKNDALSVLDRLTKDKKQFELIFCDPPYNKGLVEIVLKKIDNSDILSLHGIVVVEHSKHEQIRPDFTKLKVKRTEKYGETLVSFLTL